MTDTWDLWLWLTLGLLALVWAASAWGSWYVARRHRHMRDFVRGWVRRLRAIENGRKAMGER